MSKRQLWESLKGIVGVDRPCPFFLLIMSSFERNFKLHCRYKDGKPCTLYNVIFPTIAGRNLRQPFLVLGTRGLNAF